MEFFSNTSMDHLFYILNAETETTTTPLEQRLSWLEEVLLWLKGQDNDYHRLEQLLGHLDENQDLKVKAARLLQEILHQTSATSFFAQTGVVEQADFWGELSGRVISRILPEAPTGAELDEVLVHVYRSESDARWLEQIPEALFWRVVELICFQAQSGHPFSQLVRSLEEAIIILGARVADLGLSYDVRMRLEEKSPFQSPFHLLNGQLQKIVGQNTAVNFDDVLNYLTPCINAVHEVRSHLENHGVSIGLVHKLEVISRSLTRIEMLLQMRSSAEPVQVLFFIAHLVRSSLDSHSIRSFIINSINLLARKIVERTGVSGEHYITYNRKDFYKLLVSASGGGFITVLTSYLKLLIMKFKLPLFLEGFLVGLNYAGSFLLIQVCHFSLATKLSAFTASALAGKLREIRGPGDENRLTEEVAALMRSQIVAILGNIGFVIIGSLMFFAIFKDGLIRPLITEEYAKYVIESFHPLKSLSLFYAALTGVLLWMASLVSGWFENWMVYRKLPQALANHRGLQKTFGMAFSKKLSRWLVDNGAGAAGNISLGFMLAFLPIVGKFFGLPLDVRHVTLSAGSAAMAFCVLPFDFFQLLFCIVGVLLIGFINVGVSFSLSLLVATRARNISFLNASKLYALLVKDFSQSPKKYLLP